MKRLSSNYLRYKDNISVHNRRLGLLFVICILCCLTVITRLYNLQVINHDKLNNLAWHNQKITDSVPSIRGNITDRNGIVLAQDRTAYELWFKPTRGLNYTTTFNQITEISPELTDQLDKADIIIKRDHDFAPVLIAQDLSDDTVAKLSANKLKLSNIKIAPYYKREYFHQPETGHIIGKIRELRSTASRNLVKSIYERTPISGIELFYNETLAGHNGNRKIKVNAKQHTSGVIAQAPSQPGHNIQLSIDTRLQEKAHELFANHRGSVVAISPDNGEILTLYSSPPAYTDKNHHEKSDFNRAISGSYPLASTIKPYMGLAALASKVISPEYQIYDKGWLEYGKEHHRFHDWRKEGHGIVNLHKAIVISSDVFFYKLALKLKIKRMVAAMHKFSFGELTGIDLPNEKTGLIGTPAWKLAHGSHWYAGDTIVAGIGQGTMLATPLQLANGVAKIASRGQSWRPHLIKSGLDKIPNFQQKTIQDYTPAQWQLIATAMQDVINHGTGQRFGKTHKFTAAGKTGTAQVVSRSNAKIFADDKKYHNHSLFIAFAPVKNPKVAFAIVVENEHLAIDIALKFVEYFFEVNPDAIGK